MHGKLIGLIYLALMVIAPVLAAENEPNLCYTTHAGQCQTDTDWQKGWFWANHPPSQSSCDLYQQRFGDDDWGMCGGINGDDDSNQSSDGDSDMFVSRTHSWNPMPEDESTACPWEGVDPIIDYQDNTFICSTDF